MSRLRSLAFTGQRHFSPAQTEGGPATDIATVITALSDGLAQGFGMKLSHVGGLTRMGAVRALESGNAQPRTARWV